MATNDTIAKVEKSPLVPSGLISIEASPMAANVPAPVSNTTPAPLNRSRHAA